jgi:glycosyltransferase involved in cell wall biosynthesis
MDNKTTSILYISHSAELYGAEQSLLLLLKSLDQEEFRPIVVLPTNGPLKQELDVLSIPVKIIPSMKAWLTGRRGIQRLLHHLAIIPFILLSVWKLKRIIDRYHVHLIHTNTLVIIDGGLVAWLLKIPHIWHAREMLDDQSPHTFLFGPCVALSIVSGLSQRIVAISKAVADCFYRCKDATNIVVVYNAVTPDDSSMSDIKNDIRGQFNIPDDAPLVAQVSKLTPVKGCEDFVRAAAQIHQIMPEVVFLLIGGAPYPDYKQKITNLIADYKLEDHFILTGFRQDVSDIIRIIDLLVLPSHYEPFGRVLIEAMSAGKPVIGTTVGGIPEIIADGVTGILVPPNSPDELAKAVAKILEDPEVARQMGQAGQQRAQTFFSSQRYVREIKKVYEELR